MRPSWVLITNLLVLLLVNHVVTDSYYSPFPLISSRLSRLQAQLNQLASPALARNPSGFGVSANPARPNWGAENTPFRRIARVSYTDKLNIPVSNRPNPRTVSNIVGEQTQSPVQNSRLLIPILLTFVGQFIDHDLTLTLPPVIVADRVHLDITIPDGDKFFTPGTSIPFTRDNFIPSNPSTTPVTPRNQINTHSAFLDLTQVYGANNTFSSALRGPNGTLIGSTDPADAGQNLLPRFKQFTPSLNGTRDGNRFRGGEERTTENLALLAVQTLFFRQHNRLVARFKSLNPSLTSDQLYQAARNYNIAQFQKIVIYDWLPNLLGREKWNFWIGPYKGPDATADATIPNEFSSVAFRIGHPLLTNRFPQIDQFGNIKEVLILREMFDAFELLNNERVNLVFRGLLRTSAKEKSRMIIDDVRNFLFLSSNATIILDLFSLNLQRARQHGLADYASMRQDLGLSKVTSFNNFVSDVDTQNRLRLAYGTTAGKDNVNLIDPWVGIITENPVASDSILGQLGVRIVGETFRNIRNGDRLWFENSFPSGILKTEILATTIADIIARNTDIQPSQIQEDAFKLRTQALGSPIQDPENDSWT